MRLGAFAAVDAVFDQLLGVIPGTAGIGHEDRQKLTDDDHSGQVATERLRSQEDADQDRHQDREQGRADQLALRRGGADIDDAAIVRLLGAGPDFLVPELDAAFLDDQERGAADGTNQHRAEEERNHAADQGADEYQR